MEWFDFEQGPRQCFVIAPLLFDIFFTAVLHVVLAKFRSDGGTLRDPVRVRKLDKGAAVKKCAMAWQNKEAVQNLRGMRCAYAAGTVSRTALSLEKV